MALDSRYIVAVSQQEVFTDKDTGLVLADGEIRFFKDEDRIEPKDVFVLTGAPDYSYVNIGSTVSINAAGSPAYLGNSINIYYFPYDEDGVIERYFVQVVDSSATEQFTREAKPNVFGASGGADNGGSAFTNYIPNGQFVSHVDIVDDGLITQAVTDIALGGWTFERPVGSTSTDNVTFKRFNSFVEDPEATPRYSANVTSAGGGGGDLFKDIRVKFDDVNKFGSDSQEFTIKFSARSLIGTLDNVDFILIKNYGTGGDSETETSIETFSILPTYSNYLATFTFGDNLGKTIGSNDDDFLQLAIRFPVNSVFNVDFTNVVLREGAFSELGFPDTSTRQSVSQFLGGAFPKPATDGSDLYLTPRLTPIGWEYDSSEIGRVITKSTPDVEVGELLADGSNYFTNQKSSDGIPYSRLQKKYFDVTTQTMLYGTGLDNMTVYTPGETGSPGVLIVSNSPGIAANAADGAVPTTFTFFDVHVGVSGSYDISTWVESVTKGYFQAKAAGVVSNPADVDAGVVIGNIIAGTTQTPIEFDVTYPIGASLANGGSPGKHWLIDTPGTNYYVWYQTLAETDPAVGGRTGIKVGVFSSDDAALVAEKTTAAISNFSSSVVKTIPAASITAGSYFTASIPSEDFYIWYTIDAVGVDPNVANTTGIQVDLLSTDDALTVDSKTQLAINTRKFAIPDYRGLFLRGATFGRADIGLDDPTLRFSRANFKNSGIANGRIGSEELSKGRRHLHIANSSANSNSTTSISPSTVVASINNVSTASTGAGLAYIRSPINTSATSASTSTATTVATTIDEAQNTESRPANAYVMYVIKY